MSKKVIKNKSKRKTKKNKDRGDITELDIKNNLVKFRDDFYNIYHTLFNIYDNIYAPKSIGVYFVHDARGILYIGRSINIYKRFTQHSWIRKNKDLYNLSKNPLGKLKFSWVKTKDEKTAEKLEENWVKMFLPFCNDILFNNR